MKTIVVAGGLGLIGKAIVERLKTDKYRVIIYDYLHDSNHQDLSNPLILDRLFNAHPWINGYVNASYPPTVEKHISFFTKTTEGFATRMVGGSIVNLSSIYGITGPDDKLYQGTSMKMPVWYATAKGAIISHSRCVAIRYAPKIRINCVSPGGVQDFQNEDFVKKYIEKVPMKRMATPYDVAGVVSFLMGNDSKYITGQNIVVDGGLTSRV